MHEAVDAFGSGHLCRERDHAGGGRAEQRSRADRDRAAERVPDERDALDAAAGQQVMDEQHVEEAVLEAAGLAVVDAHATETSGKRVVQTVRRARQPAERSAEKQRRRFLARVEAVPEADDDAVGGDDLHHDDVRSDPSTPRSPVAGGG